MVGRSRVRIVLTYVPTYGILFYLWLLFYTTAPWSTVFLFSLLMNLIAFALFMLRLVVVLISFIAFLEGVRGRSSSFLEEVARSSRSLRVEEVPQLMLLAWGVGIILLRIAAERPHIVLEELLLADRLLFGWVVFGGPFVLIAVVPAMVLAWKRARSRT